MRRRRRRSTAPRCDPRARAESVARGLRSDWKGSILDLNDLPVAVAQTAVTVELDDLQCGRGARLSRSGEDLVIVTARDAADSDDDDENEPDGAARERAPAILAMLAESPEFSALDAVLDPSDDSRIRVPAARLQMWSAGAAAEATASGDDAPADDGDFSHD